jgi:hypothetical protein
MTIAMEMNQDLMSREEAAVIRVLATHLQRRMRVPDQTLEKAIRFGLPIPVANRIWRTNPGPYCLTDPSLGFDNFSPPPLFQHAYLSSLPTKMFAMIREYTNSAHEDISEAYRLMNTRPISHVKIRNLLIDESRYRPTANPTESQFRQVARSMQITEHDPLAALHSIILSAPRFHKKQYVYRGVKRVRGTSEMQGMCESLQPGHLIVCHRLTSTSYDYFLAHLFSGYLMFTIELPPFFPFLDVALLPGFANNQEMEAILPSRTILEVTHFTPIGRFVPVKESNRSMMCPFMIHARAVGICEPFLQPVVSDDVRMEMAFSPVMKNQLVWNI